MVHVNPLTIFVTDINQAKNKWINKNLLLPYLWWTTSMKIVKSPLLLSITFWSYQNNLGSEYLYLYMELLQAPISQKKF